MEYTRHRLDSRVSSVLGRLGTSTHPESAQALMERLTAFVPSVGPTPSGNELTDALAPVQWLLDRAADGGIPLTQAGYLKPVDVKTLATLLPEMQDWIFSVTREVDVHPLHAFRQFVQRAGLLRKHKGALMLTPAGRSTKDDPIALWTHLADRLMPAKPEFDEDCAVVTLIHLGSGPDDRLSTSAIAEALTHLGWAHRGGQPITSTDVRWVLSDLWSALGNIGPLTGTRRERQLSPVARSLLRDALVEYTTSE